MNVTSHEKRFKEAIRIGMLLWIRRIAETRFESEGLRWFERLPPTVDSETLKQLFGDLTLVNDIRELNVPNTEVICPPSAGPSCGC